MLKLTSKNSFLSKQIILLLVNQTSLLELYLHEPSRLSFGRSIGWSEACPLAEFLSSPVQQLTCIYSGS